VATLSIAKRIGSKENIEVSGKTSRTRISGPRGREREKEKNIEFTERLSGEKSAENAGIRAMYSSVTKLLLIINLMTNSLANWKRIFPWKKSRKRIVDIVGFFNA